MPWNAQTYSGYTRDSTEAIQNATMIVNALQGRGFSLDSCCAILGNIGGESGYNPWRWEGDNVPLSTGSLTSGYGLFQYTPASKYINQNNYDLYYGVGYAPNFLDQPGGINDGSAQLEYMADNYSNSFIHGNYAYYATEFANVGVDINNFYYLSEAEFQTGQYYNTSQSIPLEYLVGCWECCWERPNAYWAAQGYASRVDNANYWWNYFNDNPPTPPTPPTPPVTRKKMPLWMMLRRYL